MRRYSSFSSSSDLPISSGPWPVRPISSWSCFQIASNSSCTMPSGTGTDGSAPPAVEELALHPRPADGAVLLLQPLAQPGAHRVDALLAQLLGPGLVDRHRDRLLHLGHGHVEHGLLARDVGRAVVLGEGDPHLAPIARLRSRRARPRSPAPCLWSRRSVKPLRRAAVERLAVDPALEVDDDLVALTGRRGSRRRLEALAGAGQRLERLSTFASSISALSRSSSAPRARPRHLREDLEVDLELEVPCPRRTPSRRPWAGARGELAALDRLARALLDRLLEHLAHDRAAVLLPEQRQRRLAGPESGHADGPLQPLQAGPFTRVAI
jgi:hypothetical protein